MRQFSGREKMIFGACVLAIGIFILVKGMMAPFREAVGSLDQKIVLLKGKLRKNDQLLNQAKLLRGAYDTYLERFRQTKSNEQEMSSVLSEIESVASQMSLRISALKPKQVERKEHYNSFSVSLIVESDFKEMMQFLYVVQQSPHFFDVEEFRFDKSPYQKDPTIKTNFVLSKFLIP
jgi:Tfp pilus assembly protein PilO